jgi:MYXO-CTERM domain-containing protein
MVGGSLRASLWSGTAASWVDLRPAGAGPSVAFAISGGQQVGYAEVRGWPRASLWSGTAASWVNLNPAGLLSSNAWAISGGQQVGWANVGGAQHASLWSGTAASWVDLHAFLPAGFSSSDALGISSDGVNTYVAGWGFNTLTGRQEALLWTQPIPTPGVAGLLGLGGVVALRRRRGVGR